MSALTVTMGCVKQLQRVLHGLKTYSENYTVNRKKPGH